MITIAMGLFHEITQCLAEKTNELWEPPGGPLVLKGSIIMQARINQYEI